MATKTTILTAPSTLGTLGTLANGNYLTVGTLTIAASGKVPNDVGVELTATPGTVSGSGPGVYLFAQISMDGTTYTTGPGTGSSAVNEQNLVPLGFLPLNTSSGAQTDTFSLAANCPNNTLPFSVKIIAKNSTGAALASGTVRTQVQTIDIS